MIIGDMLNNKFIVTFNLIEYKFLNDTIDVIVLGETFLVYRVRGKVGVIFEENHDVVGLRGSGKCDAELAMCEAGVNEV